MNTTHALRLAVMELKHWMLVSTTKWLTAGTPLVQLKCNRCIAPAIGRLYGAGRTNMKKLLAILLLCAGVTGFGQACSDLLSQDGFELIYLGEESSFWLSDTTTDWLTARSCLLYTSDAADES